MKVRLGCTTSSKHAVTSGFVFNVQNNICVLVVNLSLPASALPQHFSLYEP
jgi:ribosomal protein S2